MSEGNGKGEREEGEVNVHRINNIKKQWIGEIEQKKKLLKQQLMQNVE